LYAKKFPRGGKYFSLTASVARIRRVDKAEGRNPPTAFALMKNGGLRRFAAYPPLYYDFVLRALKTEWMDAVSTLRF
jgi:hypothetical protein